MGVGVSLWISRVTQRSQTHWRGGAELLSQGICKDLSKPVTSLSWEVSHLLGSLLLDAS